MARGLPRRADIGIRGDSIAEFPYDMTSDGQRFLINMSLEDKRPATTSITLVTNWMAALADR